MELTKAEWALMEALWQAGHATATDLQGALEGSQGWAYHAVKTMLDRLVERGIVKARRVGNVYEYSAKSKRPTMVGRIVDDIADRFFDGAIAAFVQCLLERLKISEAEVAELKSLLDEYASEEAGR